MTNGAMARRVANREQSLTRTPRILEVIGEREQR
jgi:hypothetical protein